MQQSKRCRQVGELLKTEISRILKTRTGDPRIGFVTITDVELTRDLREARVFVSVLGGTDEIKRSLKGLKAARPHIQNELKAVVHLRYLPVLDFRLDERWMADARIEALLEDIKRKQSAGEQ